MKLIPRYYQEESSDAMVESLLNGGEDLVVLPTGTGKSLVLSLIADKLGEDILCLAPSVELVSQNYEAALEMGITDCSVYCAGLNKKEVSKVTFATVKSCKGDIDSFKHFNYVVVDEAHMGNTTSKDGERNKFLKAIDIKAVGGLTATPFVNKNTKLGKLIKLITRTRPKNFKKIIYNLNPKDVVKQGFWSPIEYNAYEFDDSLLDYNSTGNEFTDVSVRKANKKYNVNNNTYILIKKMLEAGKKGILVFVESIEVGERLTQYIPNSAMLTHKTKAKERKRIVDGFKDGTGVDVLFNMCLMQTGFNKKDLKYIIISRPIGSIITYTQIVGRGTRLAEGKDKCEVFDFGGNIRRFGKIEDLNLFETSNNGWGLYRGDTLLTGIYMHEIGDYFKEGNVLRKIYNEKSQAGNYVLEFGKYKGYAVSKTPRYYLKWMVENLDDCPVEVQEYLK